MTLYFERFTQASQPFIVEELCQSIREEKKVALILPTRQLIKKYRQEILAKLPAVLSLNILTFDDLILPKGKMPGREDQLFRQILVRKSIERCYDLKLLRKNPVHDSEGFVILAHQYITDVKSSMAQVEQISYESTLLNDFNQVLRTYVKLLEEYGLEDRYDLYLSSLDHLKSYDHIYVDGFYEFRPVELRILKYLKEQKIETSLFFHLESGDDLPLYSQRISRLKELGYEEEKFGDFQAQPFENLASHVREGKQIDRFPKEIHLVRAHQSIFLELYRLVIELKRDQQFGYENMAVIVEDETYFEQLVSLLNRFNIPSSYGRKISLTSLAKLNWLMSLIETEDSQDYYLKYFQLLPVMMDGFSASQIEGIEDLVYLIEQTPFDSLEELFDKVEFLTLLVDYNLRDLFVQAASLEGDLRSNDKLLNLILEELSATASNFQGDERDFILQAQEFFEKILSIKDLVDLPNRSFRQWLSYSLRSYKQSQKQRGLSLFTSLEARGLRFDYVYLLGFHEKTYPKLRKYDSYYRPDTLRELQTVGIKIFGQEEMAEISYSRFLELVACPGKKLYISYTDSEENILSAYFDKIQEVTKVGVEDYQIKDYLDPSLLVSDRQLERKRIRLGQGSDFLTMDKFINKKGPIQLTSDQAKNLSTKKAFTVSELNLMHECSIKYYYAQVLDLGTKGKSDALILGQACHQVFEDFYRTEKANIRSYLLGESRNWVPSRAWLAKHLERVLAKEVESKLGKVYAERYSRLIYQAIIMDLTYLQKGKEVFFPMAFEKEIKFNLGNYLLKGRIDRLDRSPSGKIQLTDYKLGASRSDFKNMKDLKDIQLALYYLSDPENIRSMKYLHLKDSTISSYFEHEDSYSSRQAFTVEALEDLVERLKIRTLGLIEAIRQGSFLEGPRDRKSCLYCPYGGFCDRKGKEE